MASVASITPEGILLRLGSSEFFLSSRRYPWFVGKTASEVRNVVQDRWGDLHWPDLDVDLELDSLTSPDRYLVLMH
jgi:hypothetical protein